MRGPEIAEDHAPDVDRIFTVPNAISMLRLAGIPVFIALLAGERRVAAAIALAIIAGTDWLDGGLARRWHQVTTVGKVLDPTIDRFLLLAAFIGLMIDGSLPIWIGCVLLTREVLIGLGGIALGLMGHTRISVTWYGKIYAFGVMAALPFFLIAHSGVFWDGVAVIAGWILIIPSAILSWVTALEYAKKAKAAIATSK